MTDKVAFSNDEKVISLFLPDVLVADQFAATFRGRASLGPEKRLILAVLEEAIRCLQKFISAGGRRHRALFRDAEEWIMAENSDWPFSFENSCLALGLNPGYLRRGLFYGRGSKNRTVSKTARQALFIDNLMTTSVVSVATKAPEQNNLPKDEYHSVKKRRLPMSKSQDRNSESREIPVKEVSEFSVSGDKLLHQLIAEKAYELYECRGCCHGQDVDDWLEAERLVLAEIELQTEKAAGNPPSEPERRKKN